MACRLRQLSYFFQAHKHVGLPRARQHGHRGRHIVLGKCRAGGTRRSESGQTQSWRTVREGKSSLKARDVKDTGVDGVKVCSGGSSAEKARTERSLPKQPPEALPQRPRRQTPSPLKPGRSPRSYRPYGRQPSNTTTGGDRTSLTINAHIANYCNAH